MHRGEQKAATISDQLDALDFFEVPKELPDGMVFFHGALLPRLLQDAGLESTVLISKLHLGYKNCKKKPWRLEKSAQCAAQQP